MDCPVWIWGAVRLDIHLDNEVGYRGSMRMGWVRITVPLPCPHAILFSTLRSYALAVEYQMTRRRLNRRLKTSECAACFVPVS
jgi:hypothetical protein